MKQTQKLRFFFVINFFCLAFSMVCKICFLIIERKGAQKVMKNYPDAVSVFLMPPDIKTLERRLKKRNTESEEAIKKRLKIAEEEISGR